MKRSQNLLCGRGSPVILILNDLGKNQRLLKTSWEKERMLAASIFFFSKKFSALLKASLIILPFTTKQILDATRSKAHVNGKLDDAQLS